MKLRDVLPIEFFDGGFDNSPAYKHLEREVVTTHEHGRWKGKHKNVFVWWSLDNGYAVGWNENPSIGWSFPSIKLKNIQSSFN
jgi:hypothetical protein